MDRRWKKKFSYPELAPVKEPGREERVSAPKRPLSPPRPTPATSPAPLLPSEQSQGQEVNVYREWARSGQYLLVER